jgi:hypothetical protein
MRRTTFLLSFGAAALGVIGGAACWAGPPYLTDDPEPVPYKHWEFYTFAQGDRTRHGNAVSGPAIEINTGAAPNLQLHLVAPYVYASQDGASA